MPDSIIPTNKAKRAFQQGAFLLGVMLVEIRQTSIMQVLANAGLDFVLIDGEHGPFNIETLADLSRAARHAGVTPIVRVPDITYAHITGPLDGGAQGIMVPRIMHAQQVREAIRMMKYPPLGIRGSVVARGHTDLKSGGVSQAMQDANRESLLIVQIETKQALESVDEILGVEGVDVALVGPTDLSVSLGVPGNMEAPILVKAIESVIEACKRRNVVPAIHINVLNQAAFWAKKGMRMVSYNSEIGILTSAAAGAVNTIRGDEAK
ncbi:MAG: aldolase [Ignavibacteriales bacterium]|nr:aldolase [Ignavibacteriales bacterium]